MACRQGCSPTLRSKRALRKQLRNRAIVVLLFVGWIGACDTVAEITFRKENLNTVNVLGFRPDTCDINASTLCEYPGCGTLDFSMETTEGRFLEPNFQIEGLDGRLTPGTNFLEEDITFGSTWLFELNEKGEDFDCSDNSECAANFECRALGSTDLPGKDQNVNQSRCVSQASVTIKGGSLRYSGLGADPSPENTRTSGRDFAGLSMALTMDNSGSLSGNYGGPIDPATATDPKADRVSAAITLVNELTAERGNTFANNFEMALIELSGSGANGVVNTFMEDTQINRSFVSEAETLKNQFQTLAVSKNGLTPVWESFLVSRDAFSQDASATNERAVFLFVDSDSDGSSSRTADDAIMAINEAGVEAQTNIVHLDSLEPDDSATLDLRTGPLVDYAQMSCQTGGYYWYDVYPAALERHFRRLGSGYEGRWSLEVDVLAANNTVLRQLDPGAYRLAGVMTVRLADATKKFDMQVTALGVFTGQESVDTRLLFLVEDDGSM